MSDAPAAAAKRMKETRSEAHAGSQIGGLFARLISYEQRSLEHDAGQNLGLQTVNNWSGVAFRLGEFRLTCRIDRVEEVIAFPPFTPLPNSKHWLLGVANVRGNLAPVVDLGWYLFKTRTPVTARTRLLLTRFQGRISGLVIDEVFGQRHFHTDDLAASPDWEETALAGLVTQSFPAGEASWGVLKLEALEHDPEFMNGGRDDT